MKETFRNIGIAILATLLIVGGTYTAIRWDAIVAKWETNAEREVFKETTTYNEAGGVAPVLRHGTRSYDWLY